MEWGLGHATRCIPIINELINLDCEVLIAAEGATASLLKEEFSTLKFLPLIGYRMKYSRKKMFLPIRMLLQFPKMVYTIYEEHNWLNQIVKQYNIDAVISDNRFGMYHSKIPSVYITHQLIIKTGNSFTESVAQKIHYHFIKKYKECWVPDFKNHGLAGELSHPENHLANIKYLGALSRFEKTYKGKKLYNLLISISGPEPQRTIFEDDLMKQLANIDKPVLFIRGLPDKEKIIESKNPMVRIVNHLRAKEMNEAILQSEIIISRCGYTTVMDLVKLQQKAILIPTPGQTEQEYLANYLKENKFFYTTKQKDFDLQKSLTHLESFPNSIPQHDMEQYKDVIRQFVQSL